MDYRVFRPLFRARDGKQKRSPTWHVEFRDHLNRRQRVTGERHQRDTEQLAGKLLRLVRHRKHAEPLPTDLRKWLDTLPEKTRERLAGMDLLDVIGEGLDRPLSLWLDGDAEGGDGQPGYRQAIAARGVTAEHVDSVIPRIRGVLDGCGFVRWRDIAGPGAATDVAVYLGKQREAKAINGSTYNYAVRDVKGFAKWLAKQLGRETPLSDLQPVENAKSDAKDRRELSPDEMRLLIATAAVGGLRFGLTGDERSLLYQFAFETGMRPGQIRTLTVSDFDFEADPPTVSTHARYVKRRREHVQLLRAGLAAKLRESFASKVPAAASFKLPSKSNMARMLRADLADARAAWLAEKGLTDKQREERGRSDFLAGVNHQKETAVFYSTRHAHGSALAAAGVPEKDIAESMHHASRVTTRRYLHSRRPELARAIAALPDVSYASPPPGATTRKRDGTGGD